MTDSHPVAGPPAVPAGDRQPDWRSDRQYRQPRQRPAPPAADRQPATASPACGPNHQPPAPPTVSTTGPAGDSQPGGELAVTHRIVTPPAPITSPPGDAPAVDDWDAPLTKRERTEDRFRGWFDGLRFVDESPGSLRDQIDFAKKGAYTVGNGKWRKINVGYARFIAAPGLTLLYLIAWAFFTRLGRAGISLLVTVPLLVVANDVPFVQWFVPDVLDLTWWLSPSPVEDELPAELVGG